MKKLLRNILFCVALSACVFLLASCGGGIKGADAKAHIQEFFAAIGSEDYSKANSLLHPERPADLKSFFESIEAAKSIDFQEGIQIKRYTGFSSAVYDGTVKGATYALTMQVTVGNKNTEFTIEIVRNDAGFGIYNIHLND